MPEVAFLLFEPSDFVSALIKDEENDEYNYYEHKFVTNCGKARQLLEAIGIDLQYLRELYFAFYSFSFERYKDDLIYRCKSYLESKNPSRTANKDKVDKLARRLIFNFFNELNSDEEFSEVLKFFNSDENNEELSDKIIELTNSYNDVENKSHQDFDIKEFHRNYLADFLTKPPYLIYLDEEESLLIESDDLNLLYQIGLTVFASSLNNSVIFEFTDFVDFQEIMPLEKGTSILLEEQTILKSRVEYLNRAFSKLKTTNTKLYSALPFERIIVHSAKEKGDFLEDLVSHIFTSQNEFRVKKNVRRKDSEIDLIVQNKMSDPFWTSLQSPMILVECKNQTKKVEPKDLRNFEVKIIDRRGLCKLGIIISTSGFTRNCYDVASKCKRDGYTMILIDNHLLQKRIDNKIETAEWLEEIMLDQC